MARTKLTEEMVGQAIRLKADGLSNGDIICALGIHESTSCRRVGNPRGRLQRASCFVRVGGTPGTDATTVWTGSPERGNR